LLPKSLICVDKGKEEVSDLTWRILFLLALILFPTSVAVCVTVNMHFVEQANTAVHPASAKPPVVLDPVDSDGPGAIRAVSLNRNTALLI